MSGLDPDATFKIASLSYDVFNKMLFGIVNVNNGGRSSSVNFNFPYSAKPHQSDAELRKDMEDEARKMLRSAASFQ